MRVTNPNAIVFSIQPLQAAYTEQVARPRAASALGLAFAVVSLIAAAGGLFSGLSYSVGQRRREFGIRIAMGAQRREIGRLVSAPCFKETDHRTAMPSQKAVCSR